MTNLPVKTKALPQDRFVYDIMQSALQAKVKVPPDYAVENAIKFAYLQIVGEGYFEKCSQGSVFNAVLKMVVLGLNPAKEQCYFINMGGKLLCMRSWYGSIAVVKRYDLNVKRINYAVVYGGDIVKTSIIKGIRYITQHEQDISNIRNDNVIGAYALALDQNGNDYASDFMTFDEIKLSWARSTKKGEYAPILANGEINPKSDHYKHPDRFCCRTVVNRLCKALLSVTNDKALIDAVNSTDEEIIDAEFIQEREPTPVDFAPAQTGWPATEEQRPEPEPLATKKQIETIFDYENKANRKDKMMDNLSGFCGRKITGLKQLTATEANAYIAFLKQELDGAPEESGPNWE